MGFAETCPNCGKGFKFAGSMAKYHGWCQGTERVQRTLTKPTVITRAAKPAKPALTGKREWATLYRRAREAGEAALKACTPQPMVVQQHANVLDDNSPVTQRWFVPEGVCGFAWVIVKPGTSSFARWLVKNNLARRDSYYGGVSVWVSDGGQSYERKSAYAHAFAKVLGEAGIDAWPMSRLD